MTTITKLLMLWGHQYTDFFLPQDDFENTEKTKIKKELQALINNEWQDKSLIGIKDPRFSLTFPIWEKVLLDNNYQLNIILAFRHPANFLKSNKKLFHNSDNWTDQRHLNFWLQLNLSAIYFTRHFPVYYINYDRLMQAPLEAAKKLANFFNLDPNLAADAFLVVNQSYYHHTEITETGNYFVDHCYELLCSHALSPADYLDYRNNISCIQ